MKNNGLDHCTIAANVVERVTSVVSSAVGDVKAVIVTSVVSVNVVDNDVEAVLVEGVVVF